MRCGIVPLAVCLLALFLGSATAQSGVDEPFGTVIVQLSDDLSGASVQGARYLELLNAAGVSAKVLQASAVVDYASLPENSLVISMGDTWQTSQLIDAEALSAIGPEGYVLRSGTNGTARTLAVNGLPGDGSEYIAYENFGLLHGCFMMLESLGYGFFHPLEPLIPDGLRFYDGPSAVIDVTSSPYWPVRGWHYHTEHPLELTEVLNGLDSNGTQWANMVPEVDLYAQWLCANGQNELEWVLLWQPSWDEYAWSTERQQRLSTLVDTMHQWGVAAGADVPIAEVQQHAWYMTTDKGKTLVENKQDIEKHIDWLMECGYDYISTESGYSEFTHPNCTLMLDWMNMATTYLMDTYEHKNIFIKCHCSTGQLCDGYINPTTGDPIDFNFLPAFADPRLGVYPHTVQLYTFFQPAPTYGNQNFTYMLDFMFSQAGKRGTVFQGESAYWVNYDIDVPLFLPSYGVNRLLDLQTMAKVQRERNVTVQGQNNFGSGWEWSYWMHNLVTARAAWDPLLSSNGTEGATADAFWPVLRTFGQEAAEAALPVLLASIEAQEELLIYGNYNGTRPDNVFKRNGIAYLEGWDTWSELESIVDVEGATQPLKLTFHEMRDPVHLFGSDPPDYETEIAPLLQAMHLNFTSLVQEMALVRPLVAAPALPFFDEIVDTMNITALRATTVYTLYEYVWSFGRRTPQWRKDQAAAALDAIVQAEEVVAHREENYRVPVSRIAGWRENPTAYEYGYLWTVHSLFYSWRDYSKATDVSLETGIPCFMNTINPVDVGFGQGVFLDTTTAIGNWLEANGFYNIGQCLIAPEEEPEYPLTPIITE